MSLEIDFFSLDEEDISLGLGFNNYRVGCRRIELKDILMLIVSLSDTQKVKNVVLKKIILESLDYAIDNYAKEERLSHELVEIAKQDNGLYILLKLFFKNQNLILDYELIKEIKVLVDTIYNQTNSKFIYLKVADVQAIIHNMIEEKFGINSHMNLNKKEMRIVLSTTRLHLEIRDIKYKDAEELIILKRKTNQFQSKVYDSPSRPKLLLGQKYIPHWKVRHLKSLLRYFPDDFQEIFSRINIVSLDLEINNYKNQIIRALTPASISIW